MYAILDKAKANTESIRHLKLAASRVRPFKCLRLPWKRKQQLVGHNVLYWARTGRGLRYSICTRLHMLNTWKVNICVCINKRLNTADSDSQTTDSLVRESVIQRHDSNRQIGTNIWSREAEGAWHQYWLTDWPSVVTCLWLWRVDRLSLALSKGPSSVGVSLLSPEDEKRSIFRNVVFSSYIEITRWIKSANAAVVIKILILSCTFISSDWGIQSLCSVTFDRRHNKRFTTVWQHVPKFIITWIWQ
jgi:hypothetical protein